jgi:hypothetical protein
MQDALAFINEPLSPEAHRLACEARDWIRRGVVPCSPSWGVTMKLIRDKRGPQCAQQLEAAIDAWYTTREAWLPALVATLAPSHPPQRARPLAAAMKLEGTSSRCTGARRQHSTHLITSPGGLLARMRYSPG